jgi:hypothetical protein
MLRLGCEANTNRIRGFMTTVLSGGRGVSTYKSVCCDRIRRAPLWEEEAMDSFLGRTCESIIMSHCRRSDICKVGYSHQLLQGGSRLPIDEDKILVKVLTSASSGFNRVMGTILKSLMVQFKG